MTACTEKLLSEGLSMGIKEEFEVERAHRCPGSRPNEGQLPRLIMIRFPRSSARDKELKVAIEKGGAQWNGCKLSLFPDMTKKLAKRRNTLTAAKHLLRDKNVKFRLGFPATQPFHSEGEEPKV